MSQKFFQIRSFFNYWLDAVDEHSLHSPFFFDFYTGVIKGRKVKLTAIESLRSKLLNDHRRITVRDLGSKRHINHQRTISSIAKGSLSPEKYSSLFLRIIRKFDHKVIMELGTSLGINAVYLAQKRDATVYTFEGAPEVASIAGITFDFVQARNIHLIEGNIDATLAAHLQKHRKVDFAFVDANHTFEPTLRYVQALLQKIHEKSVIVVDDIHSSPDMEKAWAAIKRHDLVYGSADLFRCGILFFDPSLNKQHVILQF